MTIRGATRSVLDVDGYAEGVLAGNRSVLAKAITLVESTRRDHQEMAQELLVRLQPHAGSAHRVGISGVPGVGKSTFINALGVDLTGAGNRVAVLAVDPSSTRTGGSILGDKTRMADLAVDPHAFIRPSPTSGTLGGVARATREAIVLVEAAGFDVVIVETVGVGQSETAVSDMVDCFVVLCLARSGDSLQGIKKGVLELADVLAVNKADGDHRPEARRAAGDLADALRLFPPGEGGWVPPVLTCSAVERDGLAELWEQVVAHRRLLQRSGDLTRRRQRQQVTWMWATVEQRLLGRLGSAPGVRALVPQLEADLADGSTTPTLAAEAILTAFADVS